IVRAKTPLKRTILALVALALYAGLAELVGWWALLPLIWLPARVLLRRARWLERGLDVEVWPPKTTLAAPASEPSAPPETCRPTASPPETGDRRAPLVSAATLQ